MIDNKRQFLRVTEFARRASMSPTKVYQAVADGSIPSVRIAGMIRIPAAFADDLIKRALAEVDDDEATK